MTYPPVLSLPDLAKPFLVNTNASKAVLGALLVQEGDDSSEHPTHFASETLQKSEMN